PRVNLITGPAAPQIAVALRRYMYALVRFFMAVIRSYSRIKVSATSSWLCISPMIMISSPSSAVERREEEISSSFAEYVLAPLVASIGTLSPVSWDLTKNSLDDNVSIVPETDVISLSSGAVVTRILETLITLLFNVPKAAI